MPANYLANPIATQSPSAAPGPRVSPTISIPAGSEVRTIESITQQMKVEADFVSYRSLAAASFHDDFIDAASILPNRYTIADVNSGTHTVADDSANGAFGAYKQDGTAGATASTSLQTIMASGIDLGDFMVRISVRFATTNGTTFAQIGFTNGTTVQRLYFQLNAGSLNWTLKVDAATPSPLATVAATATYQLLTIVRQNGVLSMLAGGTLLYQAADVVSRKASFVNLITTSCLAWFDYIDL